jgi:hypothetical protein
MDGSGWGLVGNGMGGGGGGEWYWVGWGGEEGG